MKETEETEETEETGINSNTKKQGKKQVFVCSIVQVFQFTNMLPVL